MHTCAHNKIKRYAPINRQRKYCSKIPKFHMHHVVLTSPNVIIASLYGSWELSFSISSTWWKWQLRNSRKQEPKRKSCYIEALSSALQEKKKSNKLLYSFFMKKVHNLISSIQHKNDVCKEMHPGSAFLLLQGLVRSK